MLPIETTSSTSVDKLFEFVPKMIDKINSIIKENKEDDE